MRVHQEITERIRYVEGFEVLVSGGKGGTTSPPYPFNRAASRKTSASDWIESRFKTAYPHFTAVVVRPDGNPLREDLPIGVAREAFHCLNRPSNLFSHYGHSIRFEFSDSVENTILEVRRVLKRAGLVVEFDRSRFLWMQSFYTRGVIRNVHLPVFQHVDLTSGLESLAKSLKVEVRHNIETIGLNLYEQNADYEFFGAAEFERFKSTVESMT